MRWITILVLLWGCSGYRFTQQDNPFSQYGISSISMPMFYNYSNMPDLSPDFTREAYKLLMGFKGLKLVSGYSRDTDAVLIGIIKSPEKVSQTLLPNNLSVAQDKAGTAIGEGRQQFYIPGTTLVDMSLQIIVIKKPTEEELTLLKSDIGGEMKFNSKIIFNERIPLKIQYNREVLDNEGVKVVGTQNAGVQRKSLKNLAEQAALSLRDMILYAF